MTAIIKKISRFSLDFAWAGVILLLPITSLPLLSRLAGNTMVAPASFIPLTWLAIWFVIYVFKKGFLPREIIPFILFISIAVFTSALAFFLNIPSYKDGTVLGEEVKAIMTLIIGAGFYLITSSWLINKPKRIGITLKFIDIGGIFLLLWTLVQAIFIFFLDGKYPDFLLQFQMIFSTRDLFINRMTGFAFEPSWLAQQLNLFYLPFWLAATITGLSAFRSRIWKLSLENILLGTGAVVLFLSSRVGTLSFLLVLAFLVIYFNIFIVHRLNEWISSKFFHFKTLLKNTLTRILPIGIAILLLVVYAMGVVGLVFVLSRLDYRLARFFQINSLSRLLKITSNIYILFNYLAFAERYVYWVAGWNIFNLHPILGVGLGNAGFYFLHTLPKYSWSLPEVLDVIYRSVSIPNIKSLWVRLLAETGIVGFASFITWCYVMLRSSLAIWRSLTKQTRMIGWFGLFVLIALIFEGFSTDTFALPYLWISMGIVSAVAAHMRILSVQEAE